MDSRSIKWVGPMRRTVGGRRGGSSDAAALRRLLAAALVVAAGFAAADDTAPRPPALPQRSPANQVFQFAVSRDYTPDAGRFAPQRSTAYLWIPPACRRVRGAVVFGQNVPEHWLAGHAEIRAACAESDLALVFTCPSCRLSAVGADADYPLADKERAQVAFLVELMQALAEVSGYEELETVPWLPIGESMSLQLVTHLLNGAPDRCIAGVHLKDGHQERIRAAGMPLLVAIGTASEYDQRKEDVATGWHLRATREAARQVARRRAVPEWPGSLVIEGGSGHFPCTEEMCRFVADYTRAAARARLAADGGATLRPVVLAEGYVAGLPVPDATAVPPKRYGDCVGDERHLPWYFDEQLARAAYDLADCDWRRRPQVAAFAAADGRPLPFAANGTFDVPILTGEDGISFDLDAVFLETLPADFTSAGVPLGHAPGRPFIDWICGPLVPLGDRRFQIALDRTHQGTNSHFRAWHPGDATYRPATAAGNLRLVPNAAGAPQTISFAEIPDQPATAGDVALEARSDAGLPVRFFVRSGPAEVHGDRLVFTPIPPRSRLPLAVTVVAWQWGRAAAPAVRTAPLVERRFHLVAPAAPSSPP